MQIFDSPFLEAKSTFLAHPRSGPCCVSQGTKGCSRREGGRTYTIDILHPSILCRLPWNRCGCVMQLDVNMVRQNLLMLSCVARYGDCMAPADELYKVLKSM